VSAALWLQVVQAMLDASREGDLARLGNAGSEATSVSLEEVYKHHHKIAEADANAGGDSLMRARKAKRPKPKPDESVQSDEESDEETHVESVVEMLEEHEFVRLHAEHDHRYVFDQAFTLFMVRRV
jgi:hypothetical protein